MTEEILVAGVTDSGGSLIEAPVIHYISADPATMPSEFSLFEELPGFRRQSDAASVESFPQGDITVFIRNWGSQLTTKDALRSNSSLYLVEGRWFTDRRDAEKQACN